MKGRAGQMHASVLAEVRRSGADEEAIAAVERVHELAMEPRIDALEDDHHPAYLHPGRCALVLLQDVGPVDVSILALAMLHESTDRALRAPDVRVREAGRVADRRRRFRGLREAGRPGRGARESGHS